MKKKKIIKRAIWFEVHGGQERSIQVPTNEPQTELKGGGDGPRGKHSLDSFFFFFFFGGWDIFFVFQLFLFRILLCTAAFALISKYKSEGIIQPNVIFISHQGNME